MTSSTDLSRQPSPRSSRHPSLALPCHPYQARPGNTTWRGLASLAGWKQLQSNSFGCRSEIDQLGGTSVLRFDNVIWN